MHQPKKSLIITALASVALGFFVNWLYGWWSEKAPELTLFINGFEIRGETLLVFPSNRPPQNLKFVLRNSGDMDADKSLVHLKVNAQIAPYIQGDWLAAPSEGLRVTDTNATVLLAKFSGIIPPRYTGSAPILTMETNVLAANFFVLYTALAAKMKQARLHVLFANPPSQTNALYGNDALDRLTAYYPGNARLKTDPNLGYSRLMKLEE